MACSYLYIIVMNSRILGIKTWSSVLLDSCLESEPSTLTPLTHLDLTAQSCISIHIHSMYGVTINHNTSQHTSLQAGVGKVPERIFCGVCHLIFYEGEVLISPLDIVEENDGKCPNCGKELDFLFSGIVIKPIKKITVT